MHLRDSGILVAKVRDRIDTENRIIRGRGRRPLEKISSCESRLRYACQRFLDRGRREIQTEVVEVPIELLADPAHATGDFKDFTAFR